MNDYGWSGTGNLIHDILFGFGHRLTHISLKFPFCGTQNATFDQGLHYSLTECSIEICIKMKNTTLHPLKRKWTGPIDKRGKFHLV